jgi:hypothetical protein
MTDVADAEQNAELAGPFLGDANPAGSGPTLGPPACPGGYRRLRDDPGPLAVPRTRLTPSEIAALSLVEFITRAHEHGAGRRIWRFELA